MTLHTVFFAGTGHDARGIAGAINDQVAVAGMHNAQMIEEIAG
jgi:hypothetical protein